MAYIFDPHVTECCVTISVRCHDTKSLTETHTYTVQSHGREVTNQLTDTVLSALHLADAAARAERSHE